MTLPTPEAKRTISREKLTARVDELEKENAALLDLAENMDGILTNAFRTQWVGSIPNTEFAAIKAKRQPVKDTASDGPYLCTCESHQVVSCRGQYNLAPGWVCAVESRKVTAAPNNKPEASL